jgi:hypothetical protein
MATCLLFTALCVPLVIISPVSVRYHPVVVALFMISFVLFTTLTMIKLVVAVVLDNFGDAVDMDLEKEVRFTHHHCVQNSTLPALALQGRACRQ